MAITRFGHEPEVVEALGTRCLVFLGMMGCGKSAIGKAVAAHLGFQFVDSDTEVEKAANMSVADIFETYGEPEFRRLEARVIERLLADGPSVVALGGGAFMDPATRERILDQSLSVWLDVDLDTLVSRVKRRPGKRPLLIGGDPRKIIRDLLDQRERVYSMANVRVSVNDGTKADTRNLVVNALKAHLDLLQEHERQDP